MRLMLQAATLLAAVSVAAAAAAVRPPESPLAGSGESGFGNPVSLYVDLRDAARRIVKVRETVPVRGAGPLTLYYPKWIPGDHTPSGPINGVTGLRFLGGGRVLEWRRDLDDAYCVHVEVPPGLVSIEIEFQFLSPAGDGGSLGGEASMTPKLAVLDWHTVLFYPSGYAARAIPFAVSARLPEGWSYGTALEAMSPAAAEKLQFKPVSLETLVDSPLVAGVHHRRTELTRVGSRPVILDVFADLASGLTLGDELLREHRNLVEQAAIVFGDHHFDRYQFLVAASDSIEHYGLEHAASSINRVPARFFQDPATFLADASLLPHEYVHAWNGKFRRPEGLATPAFNTPMRGELLWVYEGLTEYYAEVLAARAGLYSAEQFRDSLALAAASMQARSGRTWRSLQDVSDSAPVLYEAPAEWRSWRRGTDFYEEGQLLWLDVDTLIRDQSGNKRSLDDFMRAFLGTVDERRSASGYRFEDLVEALNKVQPYDWTRFLRERLDANDRDSLLDGLGRSGWKLAWAEQAGEVFRAREGKRELADLGYSIGLRISEAGDARGRLVDVLWGSAAFTGGLAPGMTLVAVNGEAYSIERLTDAIKAAADDDRGPIELLVRNGEFYSTLKVDYHDGLRYPKLVRGLTASDRLAAIIKPRK